MRIFYRSLLSFCILFAGLFTPLYAQQYVGEAIPVNHAALDVALEQWEVFRIDANALRQYIQDDPTQANVTLQLGFQQWQMELKPSGIVKPATYFLQTNDTDGAKKIIKNDKERTFKGRLTDQEGRVRLTVDQDFLYGMFTVNEQIYYLEPLRYYVEGADPDLFVYYERSAVRRDVGAECATVETEEWTDYIQHKHDEKEHEHGAESVAACYELELAIASDFSMNQKYGGPAGVEVHNLAVLNNVQDNYIGAFNHDIEFVVVTQFVSTGTDPWTNSTNAGTLLNSFRTWGNNGGFGVPFDLGELWTDRDFDAGTVGIAYLNGVCNTNKYHCLQDFTGNAELLRCMTAHEIGHNFSAGHDGAGSCPPNFIMCPFVSTADTWSAQSTTSISNYITSRINLGNCLSPCGSAAPLIADFEWSPEPACVNQPIQFTDLSTGTVTSRSWQFPGGTPATSSAQNPIVTFASAGTKNVTLTVNGPGGPSSITKAVTVLGLPVANFSYTVDGTTVTFTNSSTNATSYEWNFGDGGFATETDPIYIYQTPGVYQVVLTAINGCGTSTKTILVNTAPSADFTADPTGGCRPLVVEFENQSSPNATQFSWQFPGGTPASSTAANPTVTYNTAGSFTVTLIASNLSGSSSITKTNFINVFGPPTASFTSSTANTSVTFTNTSVGGSSYLWDFGDGDSSTEINPTHTYNAGGTYTVVLTATNDCGTATATSTVTINAAPTAIFSASPASGCAPLTVQFNNASTGVGVTYEWNFPGGNPNNSTEANPTVVYNTPGVYTVTLTATNGSGVSTATGTVTVSPGPSASFSSSTQGSTTSFTNNSSNANTYSWNFGDGNSSTNSNPTHTYAADGTYTVTLTATGPCGTATSTQTVTIVTPPTASFTSNNNSGCAPLTVQFTSTSSSNSSSYEWSFPGGSPNSSTLPNPSVTYSNPGTYTVTLTVSNSAGSSTATTSITVNPGPTAAFSSSVNGNSASFTNNSGNANSYSWNFGDGNNSTANNPTHTYAADGAYTVTLTATGPCGTATSSQTVTIVTPPTASFTANNSSGCAPLTVQFTSTSSSNSSSFAWSFPGGTPGSSTLPNPSVTYSTPGTYTVTLTATNSAGSSTATSTITVNPGPSASFSSVVSGVNVIFSNTSTNANTYSWNFGDGNSSSDANPLHTYTSDGTYTVVLTATGPCGTATSTQTVVIVTPPTAGFNASGTSGCAPLTVQFNNSSSGNSSTFSWNFPGGNPASSDLQNPLVTYITPGTYNVTLIVSNSAGSDTITQVNYVNVQALPSANFSSSVSGNTVTFNNTSTNANTYSWNFGDGGSSTEANPQHTYGEDGSFTVTLTVTGPCGTATFTQTVNIATSPTAGFSANTTSGCATLTVQFTDLSSDNTTAWQWSFPGGTPSSSTEENPLVQYDTPGTYSVTLVATSAGGSSTFVQNNYIQVQGAPVAGFNSSNNGVTVSFANTTQNGGTYLWSFGDGNTSTLANPTHTYAQGGVYTVSLLATNNCGTSNYTQTINLAGATPGVSFSPSVSNGCAVLSVTYTDQSSGNPTSWQWTFPGGMPQTSTEQNPTVMYFAPGVYSATLQATNPFGSNTMTMNNAVTVLGLPTAGFQYTINNGSVSFSNSSTDASLYSWNFGDGNTSTESNPTHTYATNGTYTVGLTAVNACGASTLQQEVTVTIVSAGEPSWVQQFEVFPNPNTGAFTVNMQGAAQQELLFTLVNPLGQIIRQDFVPFSSGVLHQVFDYGSLPSGLYTLQITGGQKTYAVKVNIQRQ